MQTDDLATVTKFRAWLYSELLTQNLMADSIEYLEELGRIRQSGRAVLKELNVLGERSLRLSLKGFLLRRRYVRLMGWGARFAYFCSAPVADTQYDAVLALGGLTNLIIALYDFELDERPGRHTPPFTEEWLASAFVNTESPSSASASRLEQLVMLYIKNLHAMPYSHTRPHIARLIQKTIVRLHRIENQTQTQLGEGNRQRVARMRSGYLFMLFGLPIWLAAASIDEDNLCWHMHWLYRLGVFLGWIDDWSDALNDRQTHHPNVVNSALRNQPNYLQLVSRIARQGDHIRKDWRQAVPLHLLYLERVLKVAVTSWSAQSESR